MHQIAALVEVEDARSAGPVVVEKIEPQLECGRFAIKRIVGQGVSVEADVFRDGHDTVAAALYVREPKATQWQHVAMEFLDNDRFTASFEIARPGPHEYTIEAWPAPFATWQEQVSKKRAAGQPLALEIDEGRALLAATIARATGSIREQLAAAIAPLDDLGDEDSRVAVMLGEALAALVSRVPDRAAATRVSPPLRIDADRRAAQFAAWYELFPRSAGVEPGKHGTFADVERRLPDIRAMGFDVVYLPPIHPIGHAFRKGPNNSLDAGPDDVGSPWAIGNENGGHTAIEPALGTFDDFAHLVAAVRANGMEIALDYALQCSPDHPWIKEHPEWFSFRSDGTIKYAENPPKKYQDIVNFNWSGPHRMSLWNALRDVVLFWSERGVATFRVDNPHTKPFAFWEWMIAEVRAKYPDTIFLAEAFTRPKVMNQLAKLGFAQSYTYFTWRDTKEELTEYLTELAETELAEFYRPSFWPNTPDILPPYLQTGGRPAFRIRLALAATLSSLYGIYSGYELCENAALPDREEYLDSEKYEIRVRDWNAPGNIKEDVTALNRIRRENPALQDWRNATFYRADDDEVIFYGKQSGDNILFIAINLDPFAARDPMLWLPTGDYGLADDEPYEIEELLGQTKHEWRGSSHRWRLDPQLNPAAIFRLRSGRLGPPIHPGPGLPGPKSPHGQSRPDVRNKN
jgi:starch synthase (maltosyl-transferring)